MKIEKEIRSKKTFMRGKIVGIYKDKVAVTFIKNDEPIYISFESFIKNCMCDEETKEIILNRIKEKLLSSYELI